MSPTSNRELEVDDSRGLWVGCLVLGAVAVIAMLLGSIITAGFILGALR